MKARFRLRYLSVAIFAVLTVAAGIMIPRVTVNYNLASYLPEQAISKQGYDVYAEEFGGMNVAKVMVRTETRSAEEYLEIFESEFGEDPAVSSVLLQAEKQDTNTALFLFTFSGRGTDAAIRPSVERMEELAGEDAVVCGQVINDIAAVEYMNSSSLLACVILVPVVLLLILLTTKSFMSMILVTLTLGISIVLNLGTNFLLGEVSFLTQGIALALQLAITLDYAIFMIHEYERQRAAGLNGSEAVRAALKKSFTSIASACLTTVAGFIALMFMRMGLGLDLGLVFVKGVLLSFASVLFLLSSLLLIFGKGVEKTSHRPLIPRFDKPARGIFKLRYVFVCLILLFIPAVLLQGNLDYRFGSAGMISGEGVPSYEAKLEVESAYGRDNSIVVLYPADTPPEKEQAFETALAAKTFGDGRPMGQVTGRTGTLAGVQAMINAQMQEVLRTQLNMPSLVFSLPYYDTAEEYLAALPSAVHAALPESLQGFVTEALIKTYIESAEVEGVKVPALVEGAYAQVNANFRGSEYTRLILSADCEEEGEEAFLMYETVLSELERAGISDALTLGETPSAYDMKEIMTADNSWISALSIIMVFLIILVTFKSISIPVILIFPILTGIYVNSAIPALMGTPIAFIGNLVVSMIHLGATIDYAILYANKYCANRKLMGRKDSTVLALSESIPSILTSAIALTVAGFSLASAVLPATAQIGLMLGRAGLLSAFFTIFVLPGLLYLCDPVVRRTTLKADFAPKDKRREEE